MNIREYFRKKQNEMQEHRKAPAGKNIEAKIGRHRKSIAVRILVVAVLLSVAAFGTYLYLDLRTYDSYKVESWEDRLDTTSTQYISFKDNILKYSQDGASFLNRSMETVWNYTYSIASPLVSISQTTVLIADQNGNDIHIFNEEGLLGKITTALPIVKAVVSNQGVVAAVLEEGNTTWIYLYDSAGTELVASKTTLNITGYPMDLAISPDGTKLMVSYITIINNVISSNVTYYNFDNVGQDYLDNLVNSKIYEGIIIPEVIYIDNNSSLAVRDDGFSVFTGSQIPEETKSVSFESDIQRVFYSDTYIGFLFLTEDETYKYKMQIYDFNGKLILEKDLETEYRQIHIEEGQIFLINDGECSILNMNGREKFYSEFSESIETVMRGKGFNGYIVIGEDSISKIKLK